MYLSYDSAIPFRSYQKEMKVMSENVHNSLIKNDLDRWLMGYASNLSTWEAHTGGWDFVASFHYTATVCFKKYCTHEKTSPSRNYSDTTIHVVCAHMDSFSSVKGRKCSLKLKVIIHGARTSHK
jgi:hypothetical protein